MSNKVLILSQAFSQEYYELFKKCLDAETVHLITGSEIKPQKGDLIFKAPKYDSQSLKSRFKSWLAFYRFVINWLKGVRDGTGYGSRNGLGDGEAYNLIFATSNPPINSYIGLKLKKKLKAPFIYLNWDIYPQIIERTIVESEKHSFFTRVVANIICKLWRKWNTKHYPEIDHMITLGPKMAESIKSATKSEIKLSVIPLGVDTEKLKPIHKAGNIFLLQHQLLNNFIVLFSGKMGLGHNIELILEAASKIQKIASDIVFIFIGQGPKFKVVDNYIRRHDVSNVLLFPWQDEDIYPHSIACGDIAIVTEEKATEGLMLPSRVFSMMACGEAIIGICGENDDLYDIVVDNDVGFCVEEISELIESIMTLYNDKEKLKKMQQRARKLVEDEYSTTKMINNYYRKII